jgi:WD40 repeat protein
VRVQFPKKGSARRGKFQDVDELSVADRYTHIRALEDEDPEERDADADEVNPQRRTQSLLHQQSPDGLGCMMSLPPSQSVTLQAHDTHVLGVWMTHDGKRMASSAKDGRVKLWDTATGAVVANLGGHHLTVNDVCVSSDGRWVATASHDNTVRLWSALSGALERELLGHQYHALSVAFSPDAQLLCSGGAD